MTTVKYFDDAVVLQRESTKHYNLNRRVVLLLALGVIKDLDVELGSPTVAIKTVPTTFEESIAIAIIIHLQLIWQPATGCVSENSLPKLVALHELYEL
jgi:hypothetical protein